jgi:hypothetical protein
MTDRTVRAILRAATAARVLSGWQGPHVPAGSYTVAPAAGPAGEWPRDRVIDYCRLLADSGIEPLYRASEPVDAG